MPLPLLQLLSTRNTKATAHTAAAATFLLHQAAGNDTESYLENAAVNFILNHSVDVNNRKRRNECSAPLELAPRVSHWLPTDSYTRCR